MTTKTFSCGPLTQANSSPEESQAPLEASGSRLQGSDAACGPAGRGTYVSTARWGPVALLAGNTFSCLYVYSLSSGEACFVSPLPATGDPNSGDLPQTVIRALKLLHHDRVDVQRGASLGKDKCFVASVNRTIVICATRCSIKSLFDSRSL